jgi:hypothetical protein
MPYTRTCVVGVAKDFKGGVHQVSALYADCFLPHDTRPLAMVLDAMQAKAERDRLHELLPLILRAKAELYELAGADLGSVISAPETASTAGTRAAPA